MIPDTDISLLIKMLSNAVIAITVVIDRLRFNSPINLYYTYLYNINTNNT